MGRMYIASTPETRGEVEDDSSAAPVAGPEGRFYLASEDKKAEAARVKDPIEQAALLGGGQPPTKEETRAAKKEQRAAEKAAKAAASPAEEPPVGDPAAQTVQEKPIAAAADQAGKPPASTKADRPGNNASRDAWEEYARAQGAEDADLQDADGEPLTRNAIRDKYGIL